MKKTILNLWISLTIAVLFFYPLLATLYDNSIILQWSVKNTKELMVALMLMSLFSFCIISAVNKYIKSKQIKTIIILILTIIPLLFFSVHFLSQIGLKQKLIYFSERGDFNKQIFLFSVILIIVLCFLIWKHPIKVNSVITIILIIFSPINIVSIWSVYSKRNIDTKISISNHKGNNVKVNNKQKKVFIIFLFDELSYEYLFRNGQVVDSYMNFKKFAEESDVYHEAKSPGQQTLTAIPGLLMNKRYENLSIKYDWIYKITNEEKEVYLLVEKENLFSMAKNKGLKTLIVGNYIPYCEMFSKYVDECRSFSEYNYATVNSNFSIINPIVTNLMILPRQKPYGIIKNIVSSLMQKKRIELTVDFIQKNINSEDEYLLFAHVYIPHLPFVFDRNGFYWNSEPYVQNDLNYKRQLEYCDLLLGYFVSKLKEFNKYDSSFIIVMSDHNYRLKFPENKNKIPVMVKHPYQKIRRDIYYETYAEKILFDKITN